MAKSAAIALLSIAFAVVLSFNAVNGIHHQVCGFFDSPCGGGCCNYETSACIDGLCIPFEELGPDFEFPKKCASPQILCNGECVDSHSDGNCGSCGNKCEDGLVCGGGLCQSPNGAEPAKECVSPQILCNGECVYLHSGSNCGGCGKKCGGGRVCIDGECIDPEDCGFAGCDINA